MRLLVSLAVVSTVLSGTAAFAADTPAVAIKNHAFSPETLVLPAGKRIKLTIANADKTAEEFDSTDLHVEKMIAGGQTATVFIGPLEPGTYNFVGELHKATAYGTIVAK
ncbi:MAG: hypothetical protein BGN87_03225 [Rhizobiales bacterium 65-79]|nr:cupredoxin domain-containing protein [Hyphomicrobiales bacterium]OJU04803.1 MAG: hypothetical protein BGN87_03225 [Rhizobiales bacterium 65-79]